MEPGELYNFKTEANATRGYRHDEATRKRISVGKRGIKPKLTPEGLTQIRRNAAFMHTPEARAKMAAASRGKKFTPEHRAKIGTGNRGKVRTPEVRARIAQSLS